jgi:hypothetical protein
VVNHHHLEGTNQQKKDLKKRPDLGRKRAAKMRRTLHSPLKPTPEEPDPPPFASVHTAANLKGYVFHPIRAEEILCLVFFQNLAEAFVFVAFSGEGAEARWRGG